VPPAQAAVAATLVAGTIFALSRFDSAPLLQGGDTAVAVQARVQASLAASGPMNQRIMSQVEPIVRRQGQPGVERSLGMATRAGGHVAAVEEAALSGAPISSTSATTAAESIATTATAATAAAVQTAAQQLSVGAVQLSKAVARGLISIMQLSIARLEAVLVAEAATVAGDATLFEEAKEAVTIVDSVLLEEKGTLVEQKLMRAEQKLLITLLGIHTSTESSNSGEAMGNGVGVEQMISMGQPGVDEQAQVEAETQAVAEKAQAVVEAKAQAEAKAKAAAEAKAKAEVAVMAEVEAKKEAKAKAKAEVENVAEKKAKEAVEAKAKAAEARAKVEVAAKALAEAKAKAEVKAKAVQTLM